MSGSIAFTVLGTDGVVISVSPETSAYSIAHRLTQGHCITSGNSVMAGEKLGIFVVLPAPGVDSQQIIDCLRGNVSQQAA